MCCGYARSGNRDFGVGLEEQGLLMMGSGIVNESSVQGFPFRTSLAIKETVLLPGGILGSSLVSGSGGVQLAVHGSSL